MGLSGEVKISTTLVQTPTTQPDLGTLQFPLNYSKLWTIVSGTSAGQADLIWHDRITLATTATQTLDLVGALTSVFGAALTYARLKVLIVSCAAANPNNLNVVRPTNGVPLFLAATDGIAVRPGGAFAWFASEATGIPVTGTTGDQIDLTNAGAGDVTADVIVIGASG